MTLFRFATCERPRALGFLAKFYPDAEVKDEGPVADVLDLVQKDIIRIPDPAFHPNGVITMSKEAPKGEEKAVVAKLQAMHDLLSAA